MPNIFFYSEQGRTPRIEYLLHILQERLKPHTLVLTTDPANLPASGGPLIMYSAKRKDMGIWIPDSGALRQKPNEWVIPKVQTHTYCSVLYPSSGDFGFPMDLPAAIFWMLARVEEYGVYTADMHGRFSGQQSLAFRAGFIDTPVVDQWIRLLKKQLNHAYPALHFEPEQGRWVSTYDIDFAWRYRHRPLTRLITTLARDLIKEGPATFFKGLGIALSKMKDPYDLYDNWMSQQAILFFPVSTLTKFDRNYSPTNPNYRSLIRQWHHAGLAGIHPSYHTADSVELLLREVEMYHDITGAPPTRSRQHYLRMRLPDTHRALEKAGVREDWTMGYADVPGYRAGTAFPFRWYDLQQERMSDLTLVPTIVMDVTLKHYLGLDASVAARRVATLWKQIQEDGGHFVTLGHNHSASDYDKDWRGWADVLLRPMMEK